MVCFKNAHLRLNVKLQTSFGAEKRIILEVFINSSANSEHLTSVAPSINRAKS